MKSLFPGRSFLTNLFNRLAVVGVVLLGGISLSFAAPAKPLVIAEKHRVAASKDTYLILVLDLKPNLDELRSAGAEASDLIKITAASYAKDYLARPEFSSNTKVVIYLISVESMDEYNRAKFDGMKRYGTITFERKSDGIVSTEDKLSFTP